MIPLVDLSAQYKEIKSEIQSIINEVLDSNLFILGKYLTAFEDRFKSMHGANGGAAVSNGTSAIQLALQTLGIGIGDEVLVPTHTFIATVEGICHVGAKPVFVDSDLDTFNLDPKQLSKKITKKTKAILPVHIYGNPCDLKPIQDFGRANNLTVIEDCAQAHFAKYRQAYVGSTSDAATFSFYPGKNLGAYGDAGFVFTQTKHQEDLLRKLLNHGRLGGKYEHDIIGYNHRCDSLQAAILNVKLNHILGWTKLRQKNAKIYHKNLNPKFQTQKTTPEAENVYHLFVMLTSNRDEVLLAMQERQIGALIHYPIPLHLHKAFAYLGHRHGDFPVAEEIAHKCISLPMYPELKESQIEEICKIANQVAVL